MSVGVELSDVSRIAELVKLVFKRADYEVDDITLNLILMVLDSHRLLRNIPPGESPEDYHRRVQRAYRDALRQVIARQAFTCPRCGMTSAHPDDVENGYCGNCKAFTGADE